MFQNKRPLIFLLVTLVGSGLVTQQSSGVFSAYASESSAYESGRDHGCDDARLNPSDRYINEPGKGPSFHTNEFMSGYYDGLNSCGGSGSKEPPRDDGGQNGRSRGDLIEDLCNFAESNPAAAAGIALLLGYPGLDAAVRGLCGFR
jgi:hypothetical protein